MQSVKNEGGSVLVFVTLMIVLLLIMVGMGLDTGHLTYARNTGQGAVDAAALAAVSGLPSRSATEVQNRAAEFNPTKANPTNTYTGSSMNSISATNVSYVTYDFASNSITNYNAPIATANGVRVALEGTQAMKSPTFLTPLLDLFVGSNTSSTKNVNVSAVAVINTKPAIPIALWSNLCGATGVQKNNVDIKLQHPTKTGLGENACWTTFLDCSSGASDIKALFQVAGECSGGGLAGDIGLGTLICQNKGQVNSSLQRADEFFMTEHKNSWWLVPVIAGTGNCDAKDPTKIVNWAKIFPTEVNDKGNPKYIKAHVTCDPTLPEQVIDTNLCFSHRLVREPGKGY
jgi:Flp pilus assembly protein TadG